MKRPLSCSRHVQLDLWSSLVTPQFTHSSQAKPFWKCSQLFQLAETAKQMAFSQYTKNDGLIFLRSRPHYKSLSDQIPDKPRTMLAKKNIYGQPDSHVSGSLSLSLSPEPCRLKWGNSEWSQIISAVLFHIWLSFYGYIFNLLHKSVLAHECYSRLMFYFHIYFVFHICFSCWVGSKELKQYMSWSLFSTFWFLGLL